MQHFDQDGASVNCEVGEPRARATFWEHRKHVDKILGATSERDRFDRDETLKHLEGFLLRKLHVVKGNGFEGRKIAPVSAGSYTFEKD